MQDLSETVALQRIWQILGDVFETEPEYHLDTGGVDAIFSLPSAEFAIEIRNSAAPSSVQQGIDQLFAASTQEASDQIPLLVVPFMTKSGRQQCSDANLSWLDLSGNASIKGKNLFVKIDGNPNRYKKRGRPRNPFAPKSSRIVRILLSNPDSVFYHKDLVERAGVSKALVSQVINSLVAEAFAERLDDDTVRLRDAHLLLREWRSRYSITKNTITRGHIYSAKEEGTRRVLELADSLASLGVEYAFTGLAAAWHYAPFSSFRLVSVLLGRSLTPSEADLLKFSAEPRGANAWLIVPGDPSAFWDSEQHDGAWFASPLQTYLDLSGHPERSQEAQLHLEKACFSWTQSASEA